MKRLYIVLTAVALVASSCQKDLGGSPDNPDVPGTVPADFNWKTTHDMAVSVAAPVVDGASPDYAVVGVYSSPILSEENLVARGVAKPAAPFRSAFTLPAGVADLYVQTTLPDGMKSVRTAAVQEEVSLVAASLKSLDAVTPKIAFNAATRAAEGGQADYTEMPMRSAADFDASRTISSTPSKPFAMGDAEYYIPQGAEITANITLDGVSHINPVLYVAGKLTLGKLAVGRGSLVVLPGGSVYVEELAASAAGHANLVHPAVYVFENGSFRCDDANVSSLEIVNRGNFEADDDLKLNGTTKFFNTEGATMKADDLSMTNSAVFHQRGSLAAGDLNMSDKAQLYVNCCTVFEDIEASNGTIALSSGAALTAGEVKLGSATANIASGAMFIVDELENSGANIVGNAQADQKPGVFVIKEETERGAWWGYTFSGMLEVVYKGRSLHRNAFRAPAYLVSSQTVYIPASVCNGGLPPVTPEPEPEPEEYETVKGQVYTYCFEDNWPWLGDYDMNDVVVVSRIDRQVSKDGAKVSKLTINWELRAGGTTYDIAYALQMDKVPSSGVASVESSHKGFGSGIFASQGLEAGSEWAVIPFFNATDELLTASNTWKGHPASPTVKHTTTVTFSQPVDIAAVKDSEMNFFVAAKSRTAEIHLPGYAPTGSGLIGKGSFLASDPYKFYVSDGVQLRNNHMMWGLMIPGEFGYPAENNDIRHVYEHFMSWASSGGTQHKEWYLEDADADKIY